MSNFVLPHEIDFALPPESFHCASKGIFGLERVLAHGVHPNGQGLAVTSRGRQVAAQCARLFLG